MGYVNESMEFNSDDENVSVIWNDFVDGENRVIPQWVVYLYFIFICFGALINLVYFLALVRTRRNGALTLIMQLSLVDCLSSYIVVLEVLTLNSQIWIFPSYHCPIFNGVEVLVNSLVIWLIICLNFHVISIWNLHKNEVKKKHVNPLTSCEEELNECLVTKKENTNRTMNIDYRKRKNDISIILPVILIVFVCFSLSVPNFILSSTLKVNNRYTICAVMDHFYGYTLQKLLLVFRILIPAPLLLFSFIILISKVVQTSPKDIDDLVLRTFLEIRGLLLCCIAITVFYMVTSFQRNFLYFWHFISYDTGKSAMIFKVPPLYNNKLNNLSNIYLSMLHYCGIIFRAFSYIFALPKFQSLVKNKVFVCCKTDT